MARITPEDPERVGHRVAQSGLAQRDRGPGEVLQRLLRRPQAGGVGHGAGQDAHRGIGGQGKEPAQQDRRRHAQQDHGRGQEVDGQALAAQGREKSGADLQADRIDEQDQAEILDEIDDRFVDAQLKMGGQDAGEQHAGNAEADAEKADLAQQDADGNDQAQDQDGMGGRVFQQQFKQPAHFLFSCAPLENAVKKILLQRPPKINLSAVLSVDLDLHQPALDRAVEQHEAPGGLQADRADQFQVAAKNVSGRALAALL